MEVEKNIKESELIARIRSGSHDAFRYLVNTYQEKVKRTCMGFVHSSADAEDITQDVFVEVFRSIGRFREESVLSTWIYRIAVNKSLNFIKSEARRKIFTYMGFFDPVESGLSGDLVSGKESSPDENLNRSELGLAVRKALESLPSGQRTAFILSRYDDLPNKEIALIMQTSEASVESLLFRAKQNLQKRLLTFYKKNLL